MLSDSVPDDVKQVLLLMFPGLLTPGLFLDSYLLWRIEFHLNAFYNKQKVNIHMHTGTEGSFFVLLSTVYHKT